MTETDTGFQPNRANPPEQTVPTIVTPEIQKNPDKFIKNAHLTQAFRGVIDKALNLRNSDEKRSPISQSEQQTASIYCAGDMQLPDFTAVARESITSRIRTRITLGQVKQDDSNPSVNPDIRKGPQDVDEEVTKAIADELDDQVIAEMRSWINTENTKRKDDGKPPIRIGIYGGGIAWVGDTLTKNEQAKAIGGLAGITREISQDASPEKRAEAGNVGAIDFMRDAGYDICITIDPKASAGEMVSSLRADALVNEEVLKRLAYPQKADDPTGKLTSGVDMVNWSNRAFKEAQLLKQSALSLSEVISYMTQGEKDTMTTALGSLQVESSDHRVNHLEHFQSVLDLVNAVSSHMPRSDNASLTDNQRRDKAFDSPADALRYLILHNGVDTFLGGAPAVAADLATPFKREPILREPTTGDMIKHTFNKGLRILSNRVARLAGEKIDSQHLVDTLQKTHIDALSGMAGWFLTRLQEMGRANGLSEAQMDSLKKDMLLSQLTQAALGTARIVSLMDTSGRTVTGDTSRVALQNEAMFGANAISVDTLRQNTGVSALGLDLTGLGNASIEPAHAEIKEGGVTYLKGIADASREGKNGSNSRYVVVNASQVRPESVSGAVLHEPRSFKNAESTPDTV
ncbi:MAG: hypothetical protein WCO78_04545 [Candidatus Roizmanbacteria bacterium]